MSESVSSDRFRYFQYIPQDNVSRRTSFEELSSLRGVAAVPWCRAPWEQVVVEEDAGSIHHLVVGHHSLPIRNDCTLVEDTTEGLPPSNHTLLRSDTAVAVVDRRAGDPGKDRLLGYQRSLVPQEPAGHHLDGEEDIHTQDTCALQGNKLEGEDALRSQIPDHSPS